MANLDEFYGNRYASLLPQTLKDIQNELFKVYSGILQGRIQSTQRFNYLQQNENEIKRFIEERFNQTYSESVSGAYADAIRQNKQIYTQRNIDFEYSPDQLALISNIRRGNTLLYSLEASKASNQIFDSLVRWAYSGSPETLGPFFVTANEIGVASYGQTIVNTQVSSFFRQVNTVAAQQSGIERFRYVGPTPERGFCKSLIGKVFSIQEINQMNNGQTDNVLATGGGFNCRHQWIPVSGDAEDKNSEEIQERFDKIGLEPPNKDKIIVQKDGQNVGVIYRKVDPDKLTYSRAQGLQQKVKKRDGDLVLNITEV